LQLIDEVLDTTRLASGKVELAFEDVDLGEIVLSAVDALVPAADAKEIRIESEMPEGICRCWADRKRIHQIVWNLLSNAVKFTPKGGTVRVRLTSTNTHLELTVSDTGIGILPENIDHVFEPLWQSPLAVGHGGLGLGLAIAKQFVELHGGSIRASSEGLGKGAAFTIVLPVQHVNVAS
jgi:signal transduction histidine kinase